MTVSIFVAGLLLGSLLGILLDRLNLLPEPLTRLADRAVPGLTAERELGAPQSAETDQRIDQNAVAGRAAPRIEEPGETAPAQPRALTPEKEMAESSGTAQMARASETGSADPGVPDVPVSSEAIDAALAFSLKSSSDPVVPGTVGAGKRDQPAERGAETSQRTRSPPIARASESPAGQVHVVYEEVQEVDPEVPSPSAEAPVNLAALVEQARARAGPELTEGPGGQPVWQANAVPTGDLGGRPMVAVVFDDLGLNRPNTRRVIELPGPLTLSFLTYAENLGDMTRSARAAGHELLVHMPMEPMDSGLDPGRNVLLAAQDHDEIRRRVQWGLDRFTGYVGINNHMGSRFTSHAAGMSVVLAELKRRGLLFLDSKTAVNSVGASLARSFGVAFIERDVFIDNDPKDLDSIRRQLDRLETVARRRGAAVGIGHPHSATIEVLSPWLSELQARGFALVPISTLVQRRIRLAEEGESAG